MLPQLDDILYMPTPPQLDGALCTSEGGRITSFRRRKPEARGVAIRASDAEERPLEAAHHLFDDVIPVARRWWTKDAPETQNGAPGG